MLNRIIIILIIIVATIGYSLYQKNSLESQLSITTEAILAKLPRASFENLEGDKVELDSFYTEGVELLIVHFWGTWCGPCEAELPDLLSLIKRFEDRPRVKFLLVAVNDEKIKVQKHLKTLAVPKASVIWLLDNSNVHRDLFGTTRVPETYVFSSDKSTLRKYVGPQEWNKTMFFQSFDEYLQISTRKL